MLVPAVNKPPHSGPAAPATLTSSRVCAALAEKRWLFDSYQKI